MIGLVLSSYRTAWLGLALGCVIGLFTRRTWVRSLVMLSAVPIVVSALIVYSPEDGGAIESRLQSFSNLSDDYSGQERLGQYGVLMRDEGALIGHGFATIDILSAGNAGIDGQIVVCWWSMGLVVGMVCLTAIIWAGMQSIRAAWRNKSLDAFGAVAITAALLLQLPLAGISSSEIGFLFWSIAAVGAKLGPARA